MAEELKNLKEVATERKRIKARLNQQSSGPIFISEAVSPLIMGALLLGLPFILQAALSLAAPDAAETARLAQDSELAALSGKFTVLMGNMTNMLSWMSYLSATAFGLKAVLKFMEIADRGEAGLSSEEQACLTLRLTELNALEERFLLEKECAQPLVTEKDRQRVKSL